MQQTLTSEISLWKTYCASPLHQLCRLVHSVSLIVQVKLQAKTKVNRGKARRLNRALQANKRLERQLKACQQALPKTQVSVSMSHTRHMPASAQKLVLHYTIHYLHSVWLELCHMQDKLKTFQEPAAGDKLPFGDKGDGNTANLTLLAAILNTAPRYQCCCNSRNAKSSMEMLVRS